MSECSTCGSEMKKGYIQSSNRLAWVPKVAKLSVEPSLKKGRFYYLIKIDFPLIMWMLFFVRIVKKSL